MEYKSFGRTQISQTEVDSEYTNIRELLSNKSKEIQEHIGEGEKKLYPQKEFAESLHIDIELLRKKIYGNKAMDRDFLFALCVVYGLNVFETNDVFKMCNEPGPDSRDGFREKYILEYIDKHSLIKGNDEVNIYFKLSSIDDINKFLEDNNQPILRIRHHNKEKNNREKKPNGKKKSTQFKYVGKVVLKTFGTYEDPYNSISTRYQPNTKCVAEVEIENNKKERCLLVASSDNTFIKYGFSKQILVSSVQQLDQMQVYPNQYNDGSKVFDNLDDTGDYRSVFEELYRKAKEEKEKLDYVLFDTKNFNNGRFGANIKNDAIHVFYEVFNYTYPLRNEYYLMEYIDGKYRLSISHNSMFMEEYLTPDEFIKHYKLLDVGKRESFFYDELIALTNSKKQPRFYSEIHKHRKCIFLKLQKLVSDKIENLRYKKEFINNLSYIFEMPYDVLEYYNLEKEFKCEHDELGNICNASENASFTYMGSETVVLSLEEINRAFELGFLDVEQIIRVKMKKADIEAVFEK